ncbi:hypothetical protein K4L06_14350 [Lysobacter sp. BMK333-48F3]|uniref:hypothetical protein n=1 Tax=Lysobacter sp. BMK333-48F3 TaxID=2867962 RepID=UPI001C8B4ACA|nr:hypothetical protein [Lysobacter sp. BMK333-48F3]MBX9402490.1 hypothetical protein [Lysobacter sp. BMK333-48F3]
MLKILIVLAVLLALAIAPVMFTARAVDAQRSSLGTVVFALIVQQAFAKSVEHFIASEPLALVIGFLGAGLLYQFLLGTTFVKGLIVSAVSTAVLVVGALIVAAVVAG